MRALLLSALLVLVPTAAAGTPAAGGSAPQRQTAPGVPARAPAATAAPLQFGQTWLLEGRSDQGRSFRSELRLGPVPADQREALEQGFRQAAGTARISALFAGMPQGPGRAQLLMLSRAAEQDLVFMMSSPDVEDPEIALEEKLSFCFLFSDPGGRSFSGLSLRMREEGETYSVTGTVGSGNTERAEMLSALRAIYAPLFGVGECRLTRR